MNKFLYLTILALACVAVVKTDDNVVEEVTSGDELVSTEKPVDNETAKLKEHLKGFAPYCQSTRQFVVNDIKSTANNAVVQIFAVLFEAADEIAQKGIDAQFQATQKLSEQLSEPQAKIAEATNEIESIIADGQQKIKDSSSPTQGLFQGIKSNIAALSSSVAAGFASRIRSAAGNINRALIPEFMRHACQKAVIYKDELQRQFERAKAELVKENPKLASVDITEINCLTSINVIRIESLCGAGQQATTPIVNFMLTTPLRNMILSARQSQQQSQQQGDNNL